LGSPSRRLPGKARAAEEMNRKQNVKEMQKEKEKQNHDQIFHLQLTFNSVLRTMIFSVEMKRSTSVVGCVSPSGA
jgi:hypothetical protein